jgi:hypothetical protein
MLDMMRKTVDRNLLKYAAGRTMFCPINGCGKILDWKTTVLVEREDGSHVGTCCADCFDAAQAQKPIPTGYRIIREGTGSPKARKPATVPQKPGKALDTWLRKTIDAAHSREDKANNCAGHGRLFPKQFGTRDWPMLETVADDGTVTIDYQGDPHFSAQQIADYVAQFCRLNHLK